MISASFMKAETKPTHVGFIMDGNRRWAREHGLPAFEGHRRGYEKMKEVGNWCLDNGVKNVTVYAFSTENWNRSREEVDYLMSLFERALRTGLEELKWQKFRLRVIGRRHGLPDKVIEAIEATERATAGNSLGNYYIALNYGGRAEIVDGLKQIVKSGLPEDEIDEASFKKYLYAPEAPWPDLIIRASGEQRLSGFLLWQSSYSELYFEQKFWPAFEESDFLAILKWYEERNRRFGK